MDVKVRYIGLVLLCTLFTTYGCEKYSSSQDCETYDYSDCNTLEPDKAILEINFTINKTYPKVPYIVYTGFIEDGNILLKDTATLSTISHLVDFGKYYSIRAEYASNGKKLYAVDGNELKKWKVDKCDSTCWETQERSFKVSLK